MLPFQNMIKNLTALKNGGVNSLIEMLVLENREFIGKLNTDLQLYKGFDAVGDKIKPAYSKLTISYKKRKGDPYDRVTLKDTGDFYRSTDVDTSATDFIIINHDEQFPKLAEKYGNKLLGLSEGNKHLLALKLKSQIIPKIKKKI